MVLAKNIGAVRLDPGEYAIVDCLVEERGAGQVCPARAPETYV